MSILKRVLRALLVLSVSAGTIAETPVPHTMRIMQESWTKERGAPEGVAAIAQTSDGFLWLGGPAGLYRFDGSRFEKFRATVGEPLLSGNVYSLFAPSSGGLWIGYTFGGVSFLRSGRVQNYGGQFAASTGSIRDFAQDKDGVIWAGSSTGLWRFDGTSWQHIGPDWNGPTSSIYSLKVDRHGVLWVLQERKLSAERDATLFCLVPRGTSFQVAGDHISSGFTLDANAKVMTQPSKTPGRTVCRFSEYPLLKSGYSQIVDRSEGIWSFKANSSGGSLTRTTLPTGSGEAIPERFAIDPKSPLDALVDREDNIWFADEVGVHRLFYSALNEQHSLPGNSPFVVLADSNGAVWIGSWTGGSKLCRVEEAVAPVCLPAVVSGGWSVAYQAPDKSLWFGGRSGLWHYVNGSPNRVELPPEMASYADYMQAIAEDKSGRMWISFGRRGLYCLEQGTWAAGGCGKLPNTGVVTEFVDALGRVWFGYINNQVVVLDGEQVEIFGPNEGVRTGNIMAISGRGSEIWIGGENGLQQFGSGQFRSISAVDSKWILGISGIVETPNGDLWLNGVNGIFHISRGQISEALASAEHQVSGERFGTREGGPGFAAQLRPLPSAVEGSDGRLWFAGNGGVVWLDPSRPLHEVAAPPVVITSVWANGTSYDPESSLVFPRHTSDVRISFAAVSLSDPESVRFRYKVQETDSAWRESDEASPVIYRNLAPGAYHFTVNASDTNGLWTNETSTAYFTILPAWYQTLAFRAAMVFLAALAMWLVHLLRVQHVSRMIVARSDERLAERTRMARELHDTFIQTIQGSKMVVDDALEKPTNAEAMHRALKQIELWLGRATTEARAALNSLRESSVERNDLREAFQRAIESSFMPGSMSVTFSVVGDFREMHPIVRDEIYRIGYEAIRNAAQHSHASHLTIEVRYGRGLTLRVSDNGIGVDLAELEKGKHGHYGLIGMRERAARIGAKFSFVSMINSGTVVTLIVPAQMVYRPMQSNVIARVAGQIRQIFRLR